MKAIMSQLEALKLVRKQNPGTTRVVRPLKGCGYRRPQNKRWSNDD